MSICRIGILFLLSFLALSLYSQANQPLATVKIGDRKYHLHLVQSGETIYKIAKQYEITVNDILFSNPWGNDTMLLVGQVIKVPTEYLSPARPDEDKVKAMSGLQPAPQAPVYTKPVVSASVTAPPKAGEYVIVEKGHTLYGLAKQYGVKVAQIQQWNGMDSLNIKIGDTILLKPPVKGVTTAPKQVLEKPVVQDRPLVEKPVSISIQESIAEKSASSEANSNLKQQFNDAQQGDRNMLTQRGSAGTVPTSNAAMKASNYCLHRTAGIGTVIRVQSLVTNKTTYVKVLGKLPDTEENQPYMLRISEAAAKELGITSEKTFVETSYYE